MGHPRAIEAVARFAQLVFAHFLQGVLIHDRIFAARNEGRHAADGVCAALMARLDEQFGVGAHKRRRHRHLRAIGEGEVRAVAELLDDAEHVIPAARIQPGDVIAQFVQNLFHLERGEDRFDQHRHFDRAARQAEFVLREIEHVVPQARFEMAFQFGQIEIWAGAFVEQASARCGRSTGRSQTANPTSVDHRPARAFR